MSEESILVEPSAENGNVPVDAPIEQPVEPVTPAEEPKEAAQPAEPTEPHLFELPDGRKVDGETLAKEWKENFLPEFTRKSQTLAEIEKAKNNNPNQTVDSPYLNPEYLPKNYEEIITVAEQRALEKFEAKQQAIIEQQQAVETEVANQLSELKKTDPNVNENALFLHANEYRAKYGVSFPDLKSAYQHMKDVAELTKTVQQNTAKNIAKRNDPISTTQGRASGALPNPAHYSSSREYYQAVKASQGNQ